MKVLIDPHTLQRALERGASEEEIRQVIFKGKAQEAKYGRFGKSMTFGFNRDRNGKYYKQKKVVVYYVQEIENLVTVTVYVFYGTWEE